MSKVEFPNQPVNIQVVVRCRPPTVKEKLTQVMAVSTKAKREVSVNMKCGQNTMNKVFKFDEVYDQDASQEQVYRGTIKPIVGEVLTGYNCTVFAYGQTGTGKTYTMEGAFDQAAPSEGTSKLGKFAGVIPRAIQQIFNTLERSGCVYTVKLSILELYNEELHDMLSPDEDVTKDLGKRAKSKLRLFDDTTRKGMGTGQGGTAMSTAGGVTISGLEEVPVRRLSEVLELMKKATDRRQIAETKLNATSSRSHMITTVTLHMKETTDTGEDLWKVGKLNLVDLAGSENIMRSGAHGKNQKEAGMINQSLLTLGRVINALVEGQPHVPYRESKLTRLLQDSLGGKTKTCIIATIAPTSACIEETTSTLEYAHRAKSIKNRPEVNQRMTKKHVVKEIMETNDELQRLLMAAREKSGIYLPTEIYERQEEERLALQGRVEELEEKVDDYRRSSRLKDKKLQMMNDVLAQLQKQVIGLDEGNSTHMNTFEQVHQKSCDKLLATIDEMRTRNDQVLEELHKVFEKIGSWVCDVNKRQADDLSGNNHRLQELLKTVVEHAETVKQWNLKVVEECVAAGEQLGLHVGCLKQDILRVNNECVEVVTAAKEDFQGFLTRINGRLKAEVFDSQLASFATLEDHAQKLAAVHARRVPMVSSAVNQVLQNELRGVVKGADEMHHRNWNMFDAAFEKLTEAMGAFALMQKENRSARQQDLTQLATHVDEASSSVSSTLQKELDSLNTDVMDKTQQLCTDSRSARIELDNTVDSISGSLVDYTRHVDHTCAKSLGFPKAVDCITQDFAACVENQEAQLQSTVLYNNQAIAGTLESLVKTKEGEIRALQQQNVVLQQRGADFCARLPSQIEGLEATQRVKGHCESCRSLLPSHKTNLQEVTNECHKRVSQHANLVKQFVANHQTATQEAAEIEDEEWDKENTTPLSSPDSRSCKPATPLTDPQGRKHMRTPLQELVNRECFAKLGSPNSGKLPPTPGGSKMVSPNNKNMVSPTAQKATTTSPTKTLSPQRALFSEDMEM
jgi:kinesin family protein 11